VKLFARVTIENRFFSERFFCIANSITKNFLAPK
jgi:hypothetical protein